MDGRHWKSLLNKSVALIGLGHLAEAQAALQKAFKLSGALLANQAWCRAQVSERVFERPATSVPRAMIAFRIM